MYECECVRVSEKEGGKESENERVRDDGRQSEGET